MRIFVLYITVFFTVSIAYSQKTHTKNQFVHVDNHAREISKQMIYHPDIIVQSLIKPFSSDIEKARVLHTWIALNIEYNYVAFKNNAKIVQNVNEVLISGKALCNGFSLIFEDFCDKADIPCVIIEGYAKGLGYENGQKFKNPNHAWNAIKIDREWFLVDVTWAAGAPVELMTNKKVIDLDSYFMSDPKEFIITHLPEDPTWQLLAQKQTFEGFENGDKIEGNWQEMNAYSPFDYDHLNEYDRDILQYKRSLKFNPDNTPLTERLSFAYIYKGISLTDELWTLDYSQLSSIEDSLNLTFNAYMDSAWMLVEPLPLIRIQKSKRIIEDEINYQKGVFNYEIGSELFNKSYNNKVPLVVISESCYPYFNEASLYFENVSPKSIYARDAKDYLNIIDQYEARMKNP